MPDTEQVDAVVVGAGFAGLYQLHLLRERGFSVRGFEAGGDVGGTWYWNRYPGARCDIESISYSYSFSPELEQDWSWSERFATQPEILGYLEHVADRFDLRRDITFETRVTGVVRDDDRQEWIVTTDTGETVRARFVIMATGCLSAPKDPEIPGAELFAGRVLHTARWPHQAVDVRGLRVGVIGTGSSGIQVIPELARQASKLLVFQRSASFTTPAANRPYSAQEIADMKTRYREWRKAQRESAFGHPFDPPAQSALAVPGEEREATYQQGWDEGRLELILAGYNDLLVDEAANDTVAEFVRDKIRSIVENPDVAEVLIPRGHPYGTKRPCLDTDYYETFNRDNVRLVDLRETPLVALTERGIETTAGEHELDVIVFATGFDAMTGTLLAMDIRGRDGVPLADQWAHGPRSYLGLAIAGFPNFFTITGPSSPSVLSNMVVSIEQHVEWITECMSTLRAGDIAEVEATVEAEDEWLAHVEEVVNATLYPRAQSWWLGANVPGKPRVFMAYVGGVNVYGDRLKAVARAGYEGFRTVPARATA